VLLDLDGVINSYTFHDETRLDYWQGMRVWIDPETVEALKPVFLEAQEVVWCTAWRHAANHDPLEYLRSQRVWVGPKLGVVSDGHTLASGGFTTAWKFGAVLESAQFMRAKVENRPVVWIEDFGWSDPHPTIPKRWLDRAGITGIDTADDGRLMMKHIEGVFT
jgi:hypothetical protein